jgi:hypothetical protein
MQELTITSPYVHSRVDSNTFTMSNPMPESTLTLCQSRPYPPVRDLGFGLRVRPTPKGMQVEITREQCKGYSCLREAPQVIRTKGRKIDTKTVESAQILSMIHFLENKSHISDANCTLHFFTSKAPLPYIYVFRTLNVLYFDRQVFPHSFSSICGVGDRVQRFCNNLVMQTL